MRVESVRTSPFRDRTVRLQFFGVLTVLCGTAWILIGLLPLLLPLVGPISAASDLPSLLMSVATNALLGGVLIGVGIGSMRRRRWVQPMMLIIAWTWLIGGVLSTALVVPLLDNVLALASGSGASPEPREVLVFKSLFTGVVVTLGILLPALYIWAYRERDVLRTCEIANPAPAWTERCPSTVLGLSVMLGAAAVLCLPLAFKPVVPWFGRLLTGWTGALFLLLGAVGALWLARSTFRLSMAGWWSTTLLMTVLGFSVTVTFLWIEPAAYYRELGFPEEQVELLDHPSIRRVLVGGTAVLTLVSLGYMAAIRKHFVAVSGRTHA